MFANWHTAPSSGKRRLRPDALAPYALLIWLMLCFSTRASAQGEDCGEPFVSVGQVQGHDDTSEYAGRTLTVEATVSADFRGGAGAFGQLHRVFVQDEPPDLDPQTSNGLGVVVNPELPVDPAAFEPGTRLRIFGLVQEVNDETQVLAESLIVCGPGKAPSAVVVTLPLRAEAFEGMLVQVNTPLRLSAMNDFAQYGELSFVAGDLARAFTDQFVPDQTSFESYEAAIDARTLVLDDGFDERYRASRFDSLVFRLGTPLSRAPTGILLPSLSRAAFRLQPTLAPQAVAPTTSSPSLVRDANHVRVVNTNLHNLFKDGGDGGKCYPTYDATSCRGLRTQNDRVQQRQLIAAKLLELDADVIVAAEVQNDFGEPATTTWQLLIDELNAKTPRKCERYEAIVPDVHLGTDAIAVALAHCASRTELLDARWPSTNWLESLVPEEQGYLGQGASRLPLAATFRQRTTGLPLTVVANHWKSRSPGSLAEGCSAFDDDCDRNTGEGYWSGSRSRAARGLLRFLTTLEASNPQAVVLAGDFNAYRMEDSVRVLTDNGYESLLERAADQGHFSYSYASRVGYLDHIFVSQQAVTRVAAFASIPGNTEGFGFDAFAYSDHNPVFADLTLSVPDDNTTNDCDCTASQAQVGSFGNDTLVGTPGDDVLCGLAGDDVLLGLGGNDCIEGGLGHDWIVEQGSVTSPMTQSDSVGYDDPLHDAPDTTSCPP